MDKVAAVAKIVEQQTAREFGASRRSHDDKQAQLQQLQQFKAEYEAQFAQRSREGLPAAQLRDYRLFMSKLDNAIEQQQREVSQAEAELAEVRAEWVAKSQRTSALDHLVDERLRLRTQARNKAEQKLSDELAMTRQPFDSE